MDWVNPHSHILLDVTDADGKVDHLVFRSSASECLVPPRMAEGFAEAR